VPTDAAFFSARLANEVRTVLALGTPKPRLRRRASQACTMLRNRITMRMQPTLTPGLPRPPSKA
jgi:hypothetical protein